MHVNKIQDEAIQRNFLSKKKVKMSPSQVIHDLSIVQFIFRNLFQKTSLMCDTKEQRRQLKTVYYSHEENAIKCKQKKSYCKLIFWVDKHLIFTSLRFGHPLNVLCVMFDEVI